MAQSKIIFNGGIIAEKRHKELYYHTVILCVLFNALKYKTSYYKIWEECDKIAPHRP